MPLLVRLCSGPLRCLQAWHHTLHPCLQAFDELLLMKRGGYVIYQGPLGEQSSAMLGYFEVSRSLRSASDMCSSGDWKRGARMACAIQVVNVPGMST